MKNVTDAFSVSVTQEPYQKLRTANSSAVGNTGNLQTGIAVPEGRVIDTTL